MTIKKTCDNNFENATDISNNDLNNNLENNDDLEIMNDINEKRLTRQIKNKKNKTRTRTRKQEEKDLCRRQ